MSRFDYLRGKIEHWSHERGIAQNGTTRGQLNKVIEEAVEGIDSIDLEGGDDEMMDALGDIGVSWLNACLTEGYDPITMLEIAYNEIKDRRGHMGVDGIFYKEQ